MKGHHVPHSLEAKEKMRQAQKTFILQHPEHRLKLASYRKGKKMSESAKEKIREFQKNKIVSLVTRKKLSEQKKGVKNHWWKGGITLQNYSARIVLMNQLEYKLWRKAVFERDAYTCQHCHERGGQLHADHIKPFALYPELRLAIDNGRTLCVPCHKKTPTWGVNVPKNTLVEV